MIQLEKTPVQLRQERLKTEIEAQLQKYFTPKWVANDPRGEEYGTIEAKIVHSGFSGMSHSVNLTLLEVDGCEKFTLKLSSEEFGKWLRNSNDAPAPLRK
jgi:hypothetical protein